MKDVFSPLFLGGKSLKELNFPEDWVYEPDLFRWRSEKHFVKLTPLVSFRETGKYLGEPHKQYLYIMDEMLVDNPASPSKT